MQRCPICSEPAGFHAGRCYAYEPADGAAGPGNSKEFMAWLKAQPKRNIKRRY